jgi:hypothetical protein
MIGASESGSVTSQVCAQTSLHVFVDVGGVQLETTRGMAAECLVVPVVSRDAGHREPVGESAGGLQPGEGRQQVATGEIPGCTEHDERTNHGDPFPLQWTHPPIVLR